MGEDEITIEVHCDDGNILHNAVSRSEIEIRGFLRKKVDSGNKDGIYL